MHDLRKHKRQLTTILNK